MGFLRVSAILLMAAAIGEWSCVAQAQSDTQPLPVPDLSGPLGSTSCLDMRDGLERMLYMTLKGSLPRQMLKEVLPGLVDPLLPVMCLQPGSDAGKWLQQQVKMTSQPRAQSRPKRQSGISLFNWMTGIGPNGRKLKDPGDHPPPGMPAHLFKDPGDRPFNMFGIRKVKDPGDRPPPPPGEAGPVNPMMQMMRMMQMMNFSRMMARMSSRFNANNNNNSNNNNGGARASAGASSGGAKA